MTVRHYLRTSPNIVRDISRSLAFKFYLDPNDLQQDLNLVLLQREKSYKEVKENGFAAWAYMVGRNYCLDLYRKNVKHQCLVPLESRPEVGRDYDPFVRDRIARIYRIVRSEFSTRHGLVMYLLAQRYDYEEMSEILKINMGTLKANIHRVRIFLQENGY